MAGALLICTDDRCSICPAIARKRVGPSPASVSGRLLRVSCSQAPATGRTPNPTSNPSLRGGKGDGAVEFRMRQFDSLFINVELKQNSSNWPQRHLSFLKKDAFFKKCFLQAWCRLNALRVYLIDPYNKPTLLWALFFNSPPILQIRQPRIRKVKSQA